MYCFCGNRVNSLTMRSYAVFGFVSQFYFSDTEDTVEKKHLFESYNQNQL